MTGRLDRLLRPKRIAVVGGGAWAENLIEQLRRIGFSGQLDVVHPAKAELAGVPTVAALSDLRAAPDCAYICVNRAATVEAVATLAVMGAGGAICFASGFREAQGDLADAAPLEEALVVAAGEMPILGPNCYGHINLLDRVALWPDVHGAEPVERGVALISQSSNIAINLTMQRRGLPIAHVVTVGNQAVVGLAEIGRALLADPRVTALGLYLEGVGDLAAFHALALEAQRAGKGIVALKVGASEAARTAAISHTASLAGAAEGARAIFARWGVGQVATLEGLLEALKLLHFSGPLAAPAIAAMSCSGGEASLIADGGLRAGLHFPALSDAQRAALRAALGPKVALANPLDYHTYIWGSVEPMAATFEAMLQGDAALGCIVVDFPHDGTGDLSTWDTLIEAAARARRRSDLPIALVSSLPETLPPHMARRIAARGLIPLCGVNAALEAMAAVAQIGALRADPVPVLLPGPGRDAQVLAEGIAKARLAAHGLRVPRAERVATCDAAAQAACRVGFPVALKGEGAAHKSEAGLVRLALRDTEAVQHAARGMPSETFLVEEMIEGGLVELLIGIMRDPAHGFLLTLGAGGRLTELVDDTATLLLPASEAEIAAALDRLRLAPVLRGYRGAPGVDRAALLAAILAVQAFAEAEASHLVELEINPLICTATDAIAVDALIRMGETT